MAIDFLVDLESVDFVWKCGQEFNLLIFLREKKIVKGIFNMLL